MEKDQVNKLKDYIEYIEDHCKIFTKYFNEIYQSEIDFCKEEISSLDLKEEDKFNKVVESVECLASLLDELQIDGYHDYYLKEKRATKIENLLD